MKHQPAFTKQAFKNELLQILDWWSTHTVDNVNGGFIGRMDGKGLVQANADKGVILNTRILWTFSAALNAGLELYKPFAERAFKYIERYFADQIEGGFYWMVDAEGNPKNKRKQIYAQAFGIYALTEYHMATGDETALERAIRIFNLIEDKSLDPVNKGYIEAMSNDWQMIEDVRLSDKDSNSVKTMNTHLHILEAYTNLYRCNPVGKIKTALSDLIQLYCDQFIDVRMGRLKLFFDINWKENMTHHSFGHEIESAWLLFEAAKVLGQDEIMRYIVPFIDAMVERVTREGISPNGGIYNERTPDGTYDTMQDWWPQAEAVVGFYDAYQRTKKKDYLRASAHCWDFINHSMKDNKHGEWFWSVDQHGIPNTVEDIAGPWKAPYHNARMCLEMIKRLQTKAHE
jgi:mannobiose 2-epimerase